MTTLKVKNVENIRKALNKVYFPLAALYSFVLSFPNNFKNVVLILLALIWVVELFTIRRFSFNRYNIKIIFLLAAYYLLCLMSVFNSKDKADAFNFFVLQTTIPLLPLLLLGKLKEVEVIKTLHVFVAGLIAVTVLAIHQTYVYHFHSFPLTLVNLQALDWSYFSFTLPISIKFHAPYFSLYASSAFLLVLFFLYKYHKQNTWFLNLIYLVLAVYIFAFMALLASRMAFFSTLVVIIVFLIYKLILSKRLVLLASSLLVLGTMSYLIVETVPYLKNKIENMDGHSERQMIWTAGIKVIADNLLFGVGTGDRKEELKKVYEQDTYVKGAVQELNLHNQYLDTTLALGVLGFFNLILIMVFVARYALHKRQYQLLAFILVFSLCCFTESLLHRQAGVLIFSYFISILAFWEKPEAYS